MIYKILKNGNLVIQFTEGERKNLREICGEPDFESDKTMYDVLEGLICNTELEWSNAVEIGALTSAPILAIYGPDRPLEAGEVVGQGNRLAGSWDGKVFVIPVEKAWAFMQYQTTSVQRELMEKGDAEFSRAW